MIPLFVGTLTFRLKTMEMCLVLSLVIYSLQRMFCEIGKSHIAVQSLTSSQLFTVTQSPLYCRSATVVV